ncbi:anti-sigma factor domain-containing protein [Streptomyces sp. NPDC001388]|uniref:anti-sigma factor n=1 Tax=Streptomyces sp. NPDC001388 TaxID=3364568 RepID=UPI00369E88CB
MKHADDETLALMAIGDAPSPSAEEHLRHCARCTEELEALRRVVATVKTPLPHDDDLMAPPDDLWEAIAGELDLASHTTGATGASAPGQGPASLRPPPTGHHAPPATTDAADPGTPVRSLPRPRRLARFTVMLAACAALLGAGAGSAVTWWVTQDNTSSTSAEDGRRLDSLQPRSAGYARLDGSSDHRTLDITVKGLPKTQGYFEVWLMDRSHSKLVSMGVLGPDGHAVLPVPDNIDLEEYSVVDVSVQPYNGKPDHSGDSVVRGPYAG